MAAVGCQLIRQKIVYPAYDARVHKVVQRRLMNVVAYLSFIGAATMWQRSCLCYWSRGESESP